MQKSPVFRFSPDSILRRGLHIGFQHKLPRRGIFHYRQSRCGFDRSGSPRGTILRAKDKRRVYLNVNVTRIRRGQRADFRTAGQMSGGRGIGRFRRSGRSGRATQRTTRRGRLFAHG